MREHLLFDSSEYCIAARIHDLLQRLLFLSFYQAICIDQLQTERTRKRCPNGALTTAGHPNDGDNRIRSHAIPGLPIQPCGV